MIRNIKYFSLHYDREFCSLKAVWDGEQSTWVYKSPGTEITSSFALWPVICAFYVPDTRSGASIQRSGIASKAREYTNHRGLPVTGICGRVCVPSRFARDSRPST